MLEWGEGKYLRWGRGRRFVHSVTPLDQTLLTPVWRIPLFAQLRFSLAVVG